MLCRDWFPIDYPDTWYQEITSNPRFFSLAATLSGSIIGLIVAETKELAQLAKEDRSLLANCFLSNTKVIFPVWLCDQWLNFSQVGYILSLGVCQSYRKQGIASLLLDQLISYLNNNFSNQVKALYLHVLTTNTQAITFYEHRLEQCSLNWEVVIHTYNTFRGFQVHSFLPYYYAIKGKRKDGYTHVLYLNGGHPTWGFLDYVKLAGVTLCSISPHRYVLEW